jgi:hypothetical protein
MIRPSIYALFFQIDMEYNHVDHGDALANRTLLNSFIDLHQSQLQLSGVPQFFYDILFHKLQNQVH